MKRLVLIFGMCYAFTAYGQNILTDDIRWNASGFTDLLSNSVVDNTPCEFISYGTHRIDWIQGNGSDVMTLTVTDNSGNWADVAQNGSSIKSVIADGLTGHVTFSRNNDVVKVELFLVGGTSDIKNVYTVLTIQQL
jgi:hypothetical protein